MKLRLVLLLLLTAISPAAEQDWTSWQWEAPYELPQIGLTRIEVPSPVLDVSRADLGDVRLLSPTRIETPYLVDSSRPLEGALRDAAGFKVVLDGSNTVIDIDTGVAGSIEGIELVSPAREFLKSVSVEDGKVRDASEKLATNEVIFRQSNGAERLRIPLPAGPRESLRITVNDDRSLPVPFTGVRILVAAEKPAINVLPVVLSVREEAPGETRLTIDLGARNLNVANLRFKIPDAVFSRNCHLEFSTIPTDGESEMERMSSGTLYRVVGDRGISAENLMIPVNRRIEARYLIATISNGDSPPLTITRTDVGIYPTVLAFYAPQAGPYQLLTGNRGATPPSYDLNPLRGVLALGNGRPTTAGPLKAKVDFKIPPALPGVESAGASIDLAGWSRQRTVDSASTGVVQIELDATALARCQLGLGDLRLVQDGRQIPYLIKPTPMIRELTPAMILLPDDPKTPTVSRWEFTLPVDGLPALELTANSQTSLFSRSFAAFVERKDELGNSWNENFGTAEWVKSQGRDTPLILHLEGSRLPLKFRLQTDHGDNPPILLESPRVRYRAPSIIAKVTGDGPLFVVYGNPQAAPPRYDLRLVEKELMDAEPQSASLGTEKVLRPDASGPKPMDVGSPWLWLALGGVVVALLVVVAKLLPRPALE